MKCFAVMEDKSLNIVEVPKPNINEYQALVRMEACGVCNGTDIKLAHHKFKNFDTYPAILGHEGVGTVVEIGDKVRSFKIGDRVLLPFIEGKAGDFYSGWGAYSEYAIVGDSNALLDDGKGNSSLFSQAYYAQQIVPDEISSVDATMIVTFREVLSAIKKFGFKPNMNVVIFGAGPVGLTFIKFLKLLGISKLFAFDIEDKKVTRAIEFGADYAYNSTENDVVKCVRGILPEGVDMVVDAVGISALINLSMELIKDCGKICSYGISPKLSMDLDWSKAPYNWKLDFVQWPAKLEESQAHDQIITWIKMGVIKPSSFISHIIDFDNIKTAFNMIENKTTDMKTVIKFLYGGN